MEDLIRPRPPFISQSTTISTPRKCFMDQRKQGWEFLVSSYKNNVNDC